MAEAPEWIVAAAHDAAVIERNAMRHLLTETETADIESARAVIRLARGMRRKLEWWQARRSFAVSR